MVGYVYLLTVLIKQILQQVQTMVSTVSFVGSDTKYSVAKSCTLDLSSFVRSSQAVVDLPLGFPPSFEFHVDTKQHKIVARYTGEYPYVVD